MTATLINITLQAIDGTLRGVKFVQLDDNSIIPVQATVNAAGALVDPATDESVQSAVTQLAAILAKLPALNGDGGALAHILNFPTVQGVSATALPLPTGAATEATLAAVRAAIQAQVDLTNSLWTDNSGAFYVRRESVNEGTGTITVSFTDPTGNPASPGAGLKPVSVAGQMVETYTYDVITAGTGTSVGDVVVRSVIIDQAAVPPTIVATAWINLTTGLVLGTQPSPSAIVAVTKDVVTRAPQNLTMTVVAIPASTSVLTVASNPSRKSLQILNIGIGFATAKPFAAAGTGGTVPTAPGQTSATSNTVALGVGYPLEAASAAGHQGGSTPIYDGVGVSIDEWDCVAGATATSILVIEGN